jgi:hypothetical protein
VELINWIWFAGAIASAAMLGIADAKARNIQHIEALWLALLWITETLLAAMQFGHNWHLATDGQVAIAVALGWKADIGQSTQNVAFDP